MYEMRILGKLFLHVVPGTPSRPDYFLNFPSIMDAKLICSLNVSIVERQLLLVCEGA